MGLLVHSVPADTTAFIGAHKWMARLSKPEYVATKLLNLYYTIIEQKLQKHIYGASE